MTDHRAVAREHLDMAKHSSNSEGARTFSAVAQVHATLALAEAADAQVAATLAQTEQLRIGNLIAFRALAHKEVASYRKNPEHWRAGIEGTVARSAIAALRIRSGLGL